VSDCCVVGVPDDEWGEAVHAVVQLANENPGGVTLADELLAHCRDRLPGHAAPRSIAVEADLPRTETGKLARRAIRNRYWAGRQRRI
jgi:acyl-CoA synthetase (AMP-forming)/AMP-acid ligase II